MLHANTHYPLLVIFCMMLVTVISWGLEILRGSGSKAAWALQIMTLLIAAVAGLIVWGTGGLIVLLIGFAIGVIAAVTRRWNEGSN